MGTPNNQDESTVHDVLVRVATADMKHRIPEGELHRHGVDTAMLEVIYERSVKPYLKYLDGYVPVGEQPGFNDIMGFSMASSDLMRLKGMQSLLLLDTELVLADDRTHVVAAKVWLLRDGTWVAWRARKRHDAGQFAENPYSEDYLYVGDSLPELCAVFNIFGNFHERGRTERHVPRFIPFMIERELRRTMSRTIEVRQSRLATLENARDDMSVHFERVSFPAH